MSSAVLCPSAMASERPGEDYIRTQCGFRSIGSLWSDVLCLVRGAMCRPQDKLGSMCCQECQRLGFSLEY